MNEIVKKIEDLKTSMSMSCFKNYNYDTSKDEEEIKALEEQLKGKTFVAVQLVDDREGFSYPQYLTSDSHLCFGSGPTWFDSKEEALEYYEKADMGNFREHQTLKFIERTF